MAIVARIVKLIINVSVSIRHIELILLFNSKIELFMLKYVLYSMRGFDVSEKFKIDDRSAYT